ncbi:uncharacterized protein LOC124455917 [Xenia sp. Carnegie-2017]|uniref:uncharacterized protein LOC124455917 n=1 Tax=Xenia sp. Carnegie-2017 TaxID=2897299 RepID=UPI001F03CDCB|nr:uncharacterized protein LOC124455917 [Xenia sp. Carnegie-2017]
MLRSSDAQRYSSEVGRELLEIDRKTGELRVVTGPNRLFDENAQAIKKKSFASDHVVVTESSKSIEATKLGTMSCSSDVQRYSSEVGRELLEFDFMTGKLRVVTGPNHLFDKKAQSIKKKTFASDHVVVTESSKSIEIKSGDTADVENPSNLHVHTEKIKEVNKILLEIVEEIPDKWNNLAIFLNVKIAKIKEIELNHRNVIWQGFEMLKFWYESRENKQLWYKELAAALREFEKNNLAEDVLHKGIKQILLMFAQEIPDKWKYLAVFLNIKDAKIKEIELNNRDVSWQGFEMLKFWFESRENKQLWYKELAAAFCNIEKNNLAEDVLLKGANVAKNC